MIIDILFLTDFGYDISGEGWGVVKLYGLTLFVLWRSCDSWWLSFMITQWENECIWSSSCPEFNSQPYYIIFHGIFPWLVTLCQPVLSQRVGKWLKLPSMAPHNLWTLKRKAKVHPWTDNGWKRNWCPPPRQVSWPRIYVRSKLTFFRGTRHNWDLNPG